MEVLIIICLLVVIVLLLLDKIQKKTDLKEKEASSFNQSVSTVLGEAKPIVLKTVVEKTTKDDEIDLLEEAREFDTTYLLEDTVFSKSVNYKEITTLVNALEQHTIDLNLEQKSLKEIAQKISGSDLLDLLEENIKGSATQIAVLLNQSSTSVLDKNQDFNLTDFL
ncbi:hypothetical protein [Myroides odoratus]|uniref:hypothetical protein n=1 Tax=Myroides odoratus TaxID=256 RepID=UPI00333FD96E